MDSAAKQLWATGNYNDGVVGYSDNCGHKQDHEVAQHFEAGTELEKVYVHAQVDFGDDWLVSSGSRWEQAFPDIRSQVLPILAWS